ncbi:MAG TPA: alpha/beta hydrolase [Candidatus Limnocylindrales bacterium]|nr:alpha/beta hydrolase [Candidatus Limnocylindrales bacterium]
MTPGNKPVGVDPASIHYVDVEGRRVRYLDEGSGHPLLLCHGFIGSLENFHTWSPAFSGHRRVLIPDLPGFGETAAGAPPHDVPAQASFLRAFADRVGIAEHDVGGICLGATVALEYAQADAQRVSRLVLHTPIYSPATLHPSFKWQARLLTAGPVFFAVDHLRRNRTASDLYKRYLVEGPGVDPYDAQVNFDNQCRADGGSARTWLRDAIRRDYAAFLSAWEKPALIVVAADDRVVRVDAIRALGRRMRQAQVRVIEAAGHGWTPALIQAQVQAISGFLAG